MTFRQIATVAKCSHGSVWAEKSAMMKEQANVVEEPKVIFPDLAAPEATKTVA